MALTDAFPGATGVVDTVELRKDLAGLIVRDSSGAARAGVFPRSSAALVTSRASMGVDVAAFEAAFVRGGGPLFAANDGTVTVALSAAPASNSRIDVVYAKQNESAAPFADANNTPTIGVVAGTAAVSPTAPAVPTGALALAQVLIPSTATTTQSAGVVVTQVFPYTATSLAPIWARNLTELTAANLADGALGYLLDKKWIGQRIGGAWQAVGAVVPFAEALIPGTASLSANVWVSLALTATSVNDVSVASSSRVTIATKGRYRISANVIFGATSDARVRFIVNGNATGPYGETSGSVTGGAGRVSASTELSLLPGDYVEAQLLTDFAGATLYGNRVTLTYIGATP